MEEHVGEAGAEQGGWLASYLDSEPWRAGEPVRNSKGQVRRGVSLNPTGLGTKPDVPEVQVPQADTQLDDMRWAYHNPRAKAKTAGQEHQQAYLKDDPKAFMALKGQMEMKAAAAGVAQYIGEQSKEAVVDEKSEELLAWGRAWLEELRGRKKSC